MDELGRADGEGEEEEREVELIMDMAVRTPELKGKRRRGVPP